MSFLNLSVRTFLSFFVLTVLSVVHAEIMIPPPGLSNGEQYRLFFMTSGERGGTSTNIGDYNAFAQMHADGSPELAALNVEWKAVVSTPTVAARDNTGTNHEVEPDGVPIYLVNGTLLASSNVQMWVDHGREFLKVDELGQVVPFENPARPEDILAWSGSLPSGAILPFPLGTDEPILGAATLGGSCLFNRPDDATAEHHLYAMSPVLTVPEPELSIRWLAFIFASAHSRKRWR